MAEPFGPEGLPLELARERILKALQPLGLVEQLPLAACLGRITAQPVLAGEAVPGYLDIIDYQGMVINSKNLTLPHPRAYEREFVLQPWLEIDPEAQLTGFGAVKELLAALI